MSDLLQIKNDDGNIIYMSGLLPDGTFGIVADEVNPFMSDESADPVKFARHMAGLRQRVDEEIGCGVQR